MDSQPEPAILLESPVNLEQVISVGSVLHVVHDVDDPDTDNPDKVPTEILGPPVSNFGALAQSLIALDPEGYILKKELEQGGGLPPQGSCNLYLAYTAYWENDLNPFDVISANKPLKVDFQDSGLLPGFDFAMKSMLVGEKAVFLFSYKVMYGEIGVPPRIKPKADCLFYIKLIKCIREPRNKVLPVKENSNLFEHVRPEVLKLYASAFTLYKSNNYPASIKLFKKAVSLLHNCRLADETEEDKQEKLLKKIYFNLVICYNKVNKPLLTCSACNELNRLKCLWNNEKALFHNAQALRMIGAYDQAEKRIKRANQLCPQNEEVEKEYNTLMSLMNAKNNTTKALGVELISDDFKQQVDEIINSFKLCNFETKITLPADLNKEEFDYVKQACIESNLYCSKLFENPPLKENGELDGDKVETGYDYVCITSTNRITSNRKGSKALYVIESNAKNVNDEPSLDI